jgi:hypothetical protein
MDSEDVFDRTVESLEHRPLDLRPFEDRLDHEVDVPESAVVRRAMDARNHLLAPSTGELRG